MLTNSERRAAEALFIISRCALHNTVYVKYKHVGIRKKKFYRGKIIKPPKKYMKGVVATIRFDDDSISEVHLPNIEFGKTWKL
jgi:hypothetical protein